MKEAGHLAYGLRQHYAKLLLQYEISQRASATTREGKDGAAGSKGRDVAMSEADADAEGEAEDEEGEDEGEGEEDDCEGISWGSFSLYLQVRALDAHARVGWRWWEG